MKKLELLLMLLLCTLPACAPAPIQAIPTPTPTFTPSPTITYTPTAPPVPTRTPLPTIPSAVLQLNPGQPVLYPATETNPYAFYSYFPKSAVREKNIAVGVWTESVDRLFDDYEYCVKRAKEYVAGLSVYSERYKIPIVVLAIPGDARLSAGTLHPDSFSTSDKMLGRPDLKLIEAVWNQYIPALKEAGFVANDKILMLGDQASGMFPHRFSILHPELVQALWVSSSAPAPLPASELNGAPLNYPLGARNLEELTGEPFDLEAYLQICQLISAGEYDNVDVVNSDFFPGGQWQYIKTHFGNTDSARAEFFYNYLLSIGAPAEFRLYKGIGNRLTDEMMKDGFEFLASHSQPALPTSIPELPSPTPAYVTNCVQGMPASPHGSSRNTTSVTYLANAGFLITAGEKKILIDGLSEKSILAAELPDKTVQDLLDAQPPFDDIDLILVTHSHWDHFSAEKTLSHLKNNPQASLVSTREVVQALSAADQNLETRLIPIQLQRRECRSLEINGIGLQILGLSHGGGQGAVENLGFIITLNGLRLFHSGDMEPDVVWLSTLQSYGLPELGLDVAFLPEFMFTTQSYHARITEGIRAAHLIPMHFAGSPKAQIRADFPKAILFEHGLETWTLP